MTSLSPRHIQGLLLAAMLSFTGCNSGERVSNDDSPDAIQGSWRVVDERLSDAGIEVVWAIDERHIVVGDGDSEVISRSRYRTDPAHTPSHIDMDLRDHGAHETRLGIYELSGNRLRFAFTVEGSSRPSNFDDGRVLVLERVRNR